jgi:hypothetical protein
MTQPEGGVAGAAAAPGFLQRIRAHFEQHERDVTIAFFAGGFVFDILTVGRIDSWWTIGQQAAYLAIISVALLQMFFEQGKPLPELAGMPALKRGYYEYRNALVHFLLGAQLSLYTIFFFKSSSLLVSFGFLGFLVALLVANELPRFKALGLRVKFALLGLCYLAFAAYVVPVFVGSIGTWVFLLSMLAGSVPLLGAAWWIGRAGTERFAQVRKQVLLPLGCVLIGFLGFYLARLIPPVPLSIPFIGVYHGVERSGEDYLLAHERPWWRLWHNGDQQFRAQPGDKVYVFFRVFSPARFADQVQMRWFWKPEGRGWALQDSIPIRIVGGREQGFRGYGVKTNYQPGEWKVQVETADGREIGRVYFDLETRPAEPRQIFLEAD